MPEDQTMRRYHIASALVASLLLCACGGQTGNEPAPEAPAPEVGEIAPAEGACDDTKAVWAVGQTADGDVLERARLDAGAEVARFLRPGQAVTMEFSVRRLNLDVDTGNTVTGVRCG
jgi:hypothetical protein